jgi:hypothetical protein
VAGSGSFYGKGHRLGAIVGRTRRPGAVDKSHLELIAKLYDASINLHCWLGLLDGLAPCIGLNGIDLTGWPWASETDLDNLFDEATDT